MYVMHVCVCVFILVEAFCFVTPLTVMLGLGPNLSQKAAC